MTSAVDTNVLVALLARTEAETEAAGRALSEAAVSGAVYAELLTTPGLGAPELDAFLAEADLEVVWSLDKAVWQAAGQAAGQAYTGYAGRRCQKGDPGPRRILADFLVGAHAAASADRLLTLDPQLYRSNFRALELVVPEAGGSKAARGQKTA